MLIESSYLFQKEIKKKIYQNTNSKVRPEFTIFYCLYNWSSVLQKCH